MLKKKDKYVVAVVGATRAVGREMIDILEERNFPAADLVLLGSEQAEGEKIEFRGKKRAVQRLTTDSFRNVDIALFCAEAAISLEYAPAAVRSGAVVIDHSSAFRMDPNVPLVVPEVNAHAIAANAGIIASPNCATIQIVMALKPLHDKATIRRIAVTTFQSVSDSGKEGMDELARQTVALLNFKEIEKDVYPHQIAFNCLPHIDSFLENGSTREEMEIIGATQKLLNDDEIRITATAVRVPVFRGNAESVNIDTRDKVSANEVRAILSSAPGITVYDDPGKNLYPTAIDMVGRDEIYIGRIREDESVPNGVSLWIVSDNLRKGAALNAVQIAEHLIQ